MGQIVNRTVVVCRLYYENLVADESRLTIMGGLREMIEPGALSFRGNCKRVGNRDPVLSRFYLIGKVGQGDGV